MLNVIPVILCGGVGSRLWPLSRSGFPKQFLCLTGEQSLFQLAALRMSSLGDGDIDVQKPIVVTGEEHRFIALEQLREVEVAPGLAILEPVGRNTAPALTAAALAAMEQGGDPILMVVPADQSVGDLQAFTDAMQSAVRDAASGNIVVLGVVPEHAATGFGYIKSQIPAPTATVRSEFSALSAFPVEKFVEKPDAVTAEAFLKEGGYFWNAGMFVLKASVWLNALESFRPDISQMTRGAWQSRTIDSHMSAAFVRFDKAAFDAIPSESIDYAVLEPAAARIRGGHRGEAGNELSSCAVTMVPLDARWSDLGAWDAVWKSLPKDADGNAQLGDVLATNSRNCLVHSSGRLVSLIGVDDLVVVETQDAVMVAHRSRCQDVKRVVDQLQSSKREEHTLHRKVHRPWGWYDSIDEGARFKVKRIQVKPGASLSLQKHHHRAEHWVVVTGTAEITCGGETRLLSENQSTYIPLGEIHRLSNPGAIPLEIIEVQSGSYLGEDDIVRLDDHYGRNR